MGLRSLSGGTRRAGVALVAALVMASVTALSSVAEAAVVPAVPAAGVGTKAALSSPQCAPDGRLAYPYPQRLPCTRPLKSGESNGGATSTGVTKDTIRIVLLLGTHAQQDAERNRPGASAPIDLATNQPAYFEDSFPPWQDVLGHSFNLWNRKFEFVTVTPTGTDEAAQRADALTVAEKKPFAVVVNVPVTAGGGQVFAAELVAKKIIVFFGGITNEEADRQAPYRYLGGFDNNAAGVNTAIFAARQLQGETAKWSGDYTSKKRVFGTVHPESGIDWQFFEDTAKKEGLKVAENVVYSVPLDTSQQATKNTEEAPTLVTKLKDEGVTTVLLFTSFQMNQALFKAADALDYHPEWVFSGMGAQDIEITARILDGLAPDQMKHVFGLGNLPLYVDTINDPQRAWFNWYWGGNQGIYSAGTFGTLHQLNGAVSFAGPKLTPKTFQQGMFSMPLRGGAASKQLQSFMTGLGPTPGLPYNVYSQVGLDYAIMWWNPDITGKGKILFDEGKGRFMYVDGGKRYAVGVDGAEWKKGEPKLFDPNVAIAQFEELPASDKVPEFPCKGCPSSSS
jgi:hypothetical protein